MTAHKVKTILGVSMVSIALLAGCSTTGGVKPPISDKAAITPDSWGSPETSTLVFGTVYRQELLFTMPFFQLDFIQINPALSPSLVTAGRKGKAFFLPPVEPGSVERLLYFMYRVGDNTFESRLSFQPGTGVTVETEAPGLKYAGSYVLTPGKRDERLPGSKYAFLPAPKGSELKSLQLIAPIFKDTAWDSLIQTRITELKNEK